MKKTEQQPALYYTMSCNYMQLNVLVIVFKTACSVPVVQAHNFRLSAQAAWKL